MFCVQDNNSIGSAIGSRTTCSDFTLIVETINSAPTIEEVTGMPFSVRVYESIIITAPIYKDLVDTNDVLTLECLTYYLDDWRDCSGLEYLPFASGVLTVTPNKNSQAYSRFIIFCVTDSNSINGSNGP